DRCAWPRGRPNAPRTRSADAPAERCTIGDPSPATPIAKRSGAPCRRPRTTASCEPTSSSGPEPSNEPEPTSSPESTNEPEPTSSPESTNEPEPTSEPESTSEPEAPLRSLADWRIRKPASHRACDSGPDRADTGPSG